MKKEHIRKLIAPVIIIFLISIYFIFIGNAILISQEFPLPVRVVGFGVPMALVIVGIFVLAERIKEIRSGEEDDISKY